MSIPVDPAPLYEQRLIVLLETAPQSNRYYQIYLNPTQFFNVSNAIVPVKTDANGMNLVNPSDLRLSPNTVVLPSELISIHQ